MCNFIITTIVHEIWFQILAFYCHISPLQRIMVNIIELLGASTLWHFACMYGVKSRMTYKEESDILYK